MLLTYRGSYPPLSLSRGFPVVGSARFCVIALMPSLSSFFTLSAPCALAPFFRLVYPWPLGCYPPHRCSRFGPLIRSPVSFCPTSHLVASRLVLSSLFSLSLTGLAASCSLLSYSLSLGVVSSFLHSIHLTLSFSLLPFFFATGVGNQRCRTTEKTIERMEAFASNSFASAREPPVFAAFYMSPSNIEDVQTHFPPVDLTIALSISFLLFPYMILLSL